MHLGYRLGLTTTVGAAEAAIGANDADNDQVTANKAVRSMEALLLILEETAEECAEHCGAGMAMNSNTNKTVG